MENPTDVKERGGCLTLYLAVAFLAVPLALLLFFGIAGDSRLTRAAPPLFVPGNILIMLAYLVFTIQTWNWKLWGLRGLYATMIISNLFSIAMGIGDPGRDILQLFVQPLILYLLTRNKMEYFE